MAEPTPLQRVIKENPCSKRIIEQLSRKWAERTRKDATPWPEEGTLVVPMLVQMEEKIKNHKRTEKGEKRKAKREMELGVLTEFAKIAGRDREEKQEGGHASGKPTAPEAPEEESEAQRLCEEGERPPPYAKTERLYPEVPKADLMCPTLEISPKLYLGGLQINGPPEDLVKYAMALEGVGETEEEEDRDEEREQDEETEQEGAKGLQINTAAATSAAQAALEPQATLKPIQIQTGGMNRLLATAAWPDGTMETEAERRRRLDEEAFKKEEERQYPLKAGNQALPESKKQPMRSGQQLQYSQTMEAHRLRSGENYLRAVGAYRGTDGELEYGEDHDQTEQERKEQWFKYWQRMAREAQEEKERRYRQCHQEYRKLERLNEGEKEDAREAQKREQQHQQEEEKQYGRQPREGMMVSRDVLDLDAAVTRLEAKAAELSKGLTLTEQHALLSRGEGEVNQKWRENQTRKMEEMTQKNEEIWGRQEYTWKKMGDWRAECSNNIERGKRTRKEVERLAKEQEEIAAAQYQMRAQALAKELEMGRMLKEMSEDLKENYESIGRMDKNQKEQLKRIDELVEITRKGTRMMEKGASLSQSLMEDPEEEEEGSSDGEEDHDPEGGARARSELGGEEEENPGEEKDLGAMKV